MNLKKLISKPRNLLMSLGLAGLLYFAKPIQSKIINVPADSSTIQAGINGALAGDTVLVAPGIYDTTSGEVFPINMKNGVILISEKGADSTIVDCAVWKHVFLGADNSKISGFTIQNGVSGIHNVRTSPTITYNLIKGNREAGIRTDGASPNIINNTIVENQFGILVYWEGTKPIIKNNISAFNYNGISSNPPCAPQLSYNDVWGNNINYWDIDPGSTDISIDPLFVDTAAGKYHLQAGSPCIDAGDPNPIYNDPDGTRNDLGAFPYHDSSSVAEKEKLKYPRIEPHPNPFTNFIKFSKKNSKLEFIIHDATGRPVRKLKGSNWNGRDYKGKEVPNGVYFVRPKGKKHQPKKIIKIK